MPFCTIPYHLVVAKVVATAAVTTDTGGLAGHPKDQLPRCKLRLNYLATRIQTLTLVNL